MWFSIFEPQGEWMIDASRFALFVLVSFLVIWLTELWLCRNWRVTRDSELNIHFAWLLLFAVYGVLVTTLSLVLSRLFKEGGIQAIFVIPYLVLGLLSFSLSWYFNRKISHKISLEVEE